MTVAAPVQADVGEAGLSRDLDGEDLPPVFHGVQALDGHPGAFVLQ